MTFSQPSPDPLGPPLSELPDGLAKGTLVQDPDGRIGEYAGQLDGEVWLRPPRGGREWSADPARCRLAGQPAASGLGQQLRARSLGSRINAAGREAS
ncbi:hypothetical protein ACFYST_33355 [Kitasatospora sp. NPDC004614]|uniref:hypothetical protein n=1 Tax=Kitasatospora sp. NPDC004614 TaxID=3364016 RepID=UPI00367A8AD7